MHFLHQRRKIFLSGKLCSEKLIVQHAVLLFMTCCHVIDIVLHMKGVKHDGHGSLGQFVNLVLEMKIQIPAASKLKISRKRIDA